MKTAEEFWQEKNGGKSSYDATLDHELITPICAVSLMKLYAKEQAIEFKNWMGGDYAIKLGQLVPATDDWTIEQWYNEFSRPMGI